MNKLGHSDLHQEVGSSVEFHSDSAVSFHCSKQLFSYSCQYRDADDVRVCREFFFSLCFKKQTWRFHQLCKSGHIGHEESSLLQELGDQSWWIVEIVAETVQYACDFLQTHHL